MRRVLILISILATAATLIAVAEGAWVYGLAIYAATVVVLVVLLRWAVRRQRAKTGQDLDSARENGADDTKASNAA